MAASLDPMIIVLALGAGASGFPVALPLLRDVAGRSPLTDIAICVFAMAVVTAQALGAVMLARFVRKAARAGGAAHAPGVPATAPRTDCFAQVTLVVSLAVVFLVSACLLVAPGARGLGLLHLGAADIAGKMKSPVLAALATGAAVLLCTGPLLRVFRREEDRSHAAAATASSSAWTWRFANVTQVASFTGAGAFLLAVSGGLYTQRGALVSVSVGVAAVIVGTVLLARVAFTRKARNAAGTGGRAARAPAADRRRFGGKLTRLAPVVSFAVICVVLTSLTAPRTHDSA